MAENMNIVLKFIMMYTTHLFKNVYILIFVIIYTSWVAETDFIFSSTRNKNEHIYIYSEDLNS